MPTPLSNGILLKSARPARISRKSSKNLLLTTGKSNWRLNMSDNLKGKTALVTGSSRGLGKIIAGRFLEEGANVVLTSQNEKELESAFSELKDLSGNVLPVQADIRDGKQVAELVKKAVSEFGSLDILVNNAGVFKDGAVDQMELSDFELTFDVGVKGAFLSTRETVRQMKKQKGGQIINICSIGSKLGLENLSAYCASKGALARFGDSLKIELKPYGIRVTNIFPHSMNTMGRDIDENSKERMRMIEPHDVADAILMVVTSKRYVQYQDITIFPYSTSLTKTEE
ncbi:MAG: SDR family NAD(P)-dependent oxidoreductase [candidate division Zixibacteria bacterium]|nr:SDR family NAD(P)-dependent oxidoreductase [candidate division Zixibacteria bacterium]